VICEIYFWEKLGRMCILNQRFSAFEKFKKMKEEETSVALGQTILNKITHI
jgi:hypothetical protein